MKKSYFVFSILCLLITTSSVTYGFDGRQLHAGSECYSIFQESGRGTRNSSYYNNTSKSQYIECPVVNRRPFKKGTFDVYVNVKNGYGGKFFCVLTRKNRNGQLLHSTSASDKRVGYHAIGLHSTKKYTGDTLSVLCVIPKYSYLFAYQVIENKY